MKKILLSILLTSITAFAYSQGWQYVGTASISTVTGSSGYLYFGDLEFNTDGNIFVSFWDNSNKLHMAKYDGTSWKKMPSPGNKKANYVDIEVHDSDYYIGYATTFSNGVSYGFVEKYDNASGKWSQLGDSILLGSASLDLILDNNGVPTLLNGLKKALSNKEIYQYSSGAWKSVYTLPNSSPSIYQENSAIFDSKNKLIIGTGGYVTSPSFSYYLAINSFDGTSTTPVGDTLRFSGGNLRIKLDKNDVPYLLLNPGFAKFSAFKLNGSKWNEVGDTAGAKKVGTMYYTDISKDEQIVFSTLDLTFTGKSFYFFDNGTRYDMDTFKSSAISDLVIPKGTNTVYAMVQTAHGYGVIKHEVSKTTGIDNVNSTAEMVQVYPNPSTGSFTLSFRGMKGNASIRIYNMNGQVVYQNMADMSTNIVVNELHTPGLYMIEILGRDGSASRSKIIIR